MPRVNIEITDHIAHLRLTRGDKMNGLDAKMIDALIAAGQDLMGADDVRAVVMSGEGRAFCAGLDIMSFASLAQSDPHELIMPRTHGNCNQWQEVVMIWRRLPMLVIAALHGPVFGAGFQLALGADMRIAAPDTQMAIMEMKWGLVPDMGGMALLPRLTRDDVIRRMTYSAQPFGVDQMRDWGLVTEVADDPLAVAMEIAGDIAGRSPSAIRAAKALIDQAFALGEAEVLLAESQAQADLVGKPDMLAAIARNFG